MSLDTSLEYPLWLLMAHKHCVAEMMLLDMNRRDFFLLGFVSFNCGKFEGDKHILEAFRMGRTAQEYTHAVIADAGKDWDRGNRWSGDAQIRLLILRKLHRSDYRHPSINRMDNY